MDDEHVESFDLNGEKIKTTVIDIANQKMVDKHISCLLRSASVKRTKVIGLDIQFFINHKGISDNRFRNWYGSKCAILNFCVGYSCLIIRLKRIDSFQGFSYSLSSVLNLLSLPDYTFVGVGIKHNLAKLEQQHGIGCMNAVELGSLAATLMNKPHLSFCGVDELALVVNKLDFRNDRPISVSYDWGSSPLMIELVKLTTINAYSYYKIGSTLLGLHASIPQIIDE